MSFEPEYLVLFVPHMLFALSVHEAAHAYVAYLFGDDTAALMGRVTLNPLKHLDPFGAVAFFIIGFGWAKPVPINPLRLKNPRRDNIFISLAGPASNLLVGLIVLSAILMLYYVVKLRSGPGSELLAFLLIGAHLNIGLCLFNLIPVPPLDGSHILLGILPEKLADQVEPIFARGVLLLLAVIMISSFANLDIFGWLIWKPMGVIVQTVLGEDAFLAAARALKLFLTP